MIGLYYLILVGLYILVGFFAIRWLVRMQEKKQIKVLVIVIACVVWLLIPTYDEILGRIYFNHLCKTETGVKVYQTIELPAEYWGDDGRPKFYVNRYDRNKVRFIFLDKSVKDVPELVYTWEEIKRDLSFHVGEDVLEISLRDSGAILGDYKLFRYWGGWVKRNFIPHNTAKSCALKDLNGWELKVFKPVVIPDSEGEEK